MDFTRARRFIGGIDIIKKRCGNHTVSLLDWRACIGRFLSYGLILLMNQLETFVWWCESVRVLRNTLPLRITVGSCRLIETLFIIVKQLFIFHLEPWNFVCTLLLGSFFIFWKKLFLPWEAPHSAYISEIFINANKIMKFGIQQPNRTLFRIHKKNL